MKNAKCIHVQSANKMPVISVFRKRNKTTEMWSCYARELQRHFAVTYAVGINNVTRNSLLRCIDDTREYLQQYFGDPIHEKRFDDIITALNHRYGQDECILEARLKFYHTKMKEHQTYAEWVTELKTAAKQCQFYCGKDDCKESYVDKQIRDMIVLHTPHESVRTAALKMTNPSLSDVLQLAAANMEMKALSGDSGVATLSNLGAEISHDNPITLQNLKFRNTRTNVQ